MPGPDSIRAELGLLDRPTPEQGGYVRSGTAFPYRVVVGIFRMADGAVAAVISEFHHVRRDCGRGRAGSRIR